MVLPLLAPLIGNFAASMIPSLGASVAGAVGAAGAAGPLIAAAAPKAIGAGIGSLLAGASAGDVAMNALSFGAQAFGGGGSGATNTVMASQGPPPAAGQQIAQMLGRPTQQGVPPPPMQQGAGTQMGGALGGPMGSASAPMMPRQVPQQGPASSAQPYAPLGAGALSGGLGSLPAMGGQPMPSVSQMIGSLGPNAPAAQQYLTGQRGFF